VPINGIGLGSGPLRTIFTTSNHVQAVLLLLAINIDK